MADPVLASMEIASVTGVVEHGFFLGQHQRHRMITLMRMQAWLTP
jgi:ribose 5-phosphate isomerase